MIDHDTPQQPPAAPDSDSTGFILDDPPIHLRRTTLVFWQEVATHFGLTPEDCAILTLACESWDRGVEAREALAEHGTTYTDRFGQPRARPEVAIERDSRLAFLRLIRSLRLDLQTRGKHP
jgi:phage terminase small subunit